MEKKHNNKELKGKEPKKKYEFEVEEMEERIAPRKGSADDVGGQDGGTFWR
ncbi:MAG: hypothetical protein HYU64_02010 [Armatimonadetes bacterium]|nr:hypothetical protein [Armatimonadota bacterium]